MTNVVFNFTNRCNLQCRHCYGSCGPRGETMSIENIVKVLEHIPKDTEVLSISGGEPFVERQKLMQMLEYIKENKKRIFPEMKVAIISNGFWANNEDSTEQTLREVYEKGASFLQIPSLDKFHREQGLIIDPWMIYPNGRIYKLIEKIAAENNASFRSGFPGLSLYPSDSKGGFEVRIVGSDLVHPFGRGKDVKKNEQRLNSHCSISAFHHDRLSYDELTVAPDGKAYPCCWRVTPSIGSAIESPLEELLRNMEKNELSCALLEEGPEGVAKMLGVYNEEERRRYIENPCVKCEEIFRGIR